VAISAVFAVAVESCWIRLRTRFLQEGVDRHSTRTSLLLVELERRDSIQVSSAGSEEIAGQYDAAGLASSHTKTWWPLGVPGADLMMTLAYQTRSYSSSLIRLAFSAKLRKSRGLKRAGELSTKPGVAFNLPQRARWRSGNALALAV